MQDRLLVLTRYVPRPDVNSADLRFFSMLKILSSLFEVTCFTRWLRESDEKYVAALRELGILVLSGQEHSFSGILKRGDFTAALFEFYFLAEYYLPRIRMLLPDCLIVIDSVDVHYYRAFSKYDVTKMPSDLAEAERIKKLELGLYDKADMIIAVTDEDAGVLTTDSPGLRVRVIPNIHSLELSDSSPDKNGLVFVGAFFHDPNVDAILYFCHEILPIIRETIPSVRLQVIGSDPPAEVRALGGTSINVTGFVPSTTPYLHGSYVSIAPLRYGAGMKGKIGEAMAHGRPVVTTSIGAQGMGLTNRENVMISDSPTEFAKCVIELIQDEELYRRIQKGAIEHIERNYTVEQVGRGIDSVVSELKTMGPGQMPFWEKVSFLSQYAMERIKASWGRP